VREGERLAPELTQYEPDIALYGGGDDGLEIYRRLVPAVAGIPFVAFEIAGWQAEAVGALLEGYSIEVLRDLAGIDRVVVGRL
jgi:methylase of polypeptide subunit release factors